MTKQYSYKGFIILRTRSDTYYPWYIKGGLTTSGKILYRTPEEARAEIDRHICTLTSLTPPLT